MSRNSRQRRKFKRRRGRSRPESRTRRCSLETLEPRRLLCANALDTDSVLQCATVAVSSVAYSEPLVGSIGEDGNLTVGPNDIDLYSMWFREGQEISFEVDPSSNVLPSMRIFDAAGEELAITQLRQMSYVFPSDDTYYLGISSPGNDDYDTTLAGSGLGGSAEGNYSIRVESSRSLGQPILVNARQEGQQYLSSLSIDGLDRSIVLYRDDGLYVQRLGADGERLEDAFFITDGFARGDVSANARGDFVVVYAQYDLGYRLFARPFQVIGDSVTEMPPIEIETSNSMGGYSVAISDDGSFAVTWLSNRKTYIRQFASDGEGTYTGLAKTAIDETDPGVQWAASNQSVAAKPDGGYYVIWKRGLEDIYLREFDSEGAPQNPPQLVASAADLEFSEVIYGPVFTTASEQKSIGWVELATDSRGTAFVMVEGKYRLDLSDDDLSNNSGKHPNDESHFSQQIVVLSYDSTNGWNSPLLLAEATYRTSIAADPDGRRLVSPSFAVDGLDRIGLTWQEYDTSLGTNNRLIQWWKTNGSASSDVFTVPQTSTTSESPWLGYGDLTANGRGTFVTAGHNFNVSDFDVYALSFQPGPLLPIDRIVPRFLAIGDQTTPANTIVSVPIRVDYESNRLEGLEYLLVGDSPNANVVVDPDDRSQATLSWNAPAEEGIYPVTLQVVDSADRTRSDVVTFQIYVGEANQPPIIAPIRDQYGIAGEPLRFATSALDQDGPERHLRYRLDESAPIGAAIHPFTGTFTWTPQAGQVGTHFVDVIVSDGGIPQLSDVVTTRLIVRSPNISPSIVVPIDISFEEDSDFTFFGVDRIVIRDNDSNDLSLSLTAENGSILLFSSMGLTYSIGQSQPANRIKVRGTAADLNAALDGMTFIPDDRFHGNTSILVSVDDNGNAGTNFPRVTDAIVAMSITSVEDAPFVPDQRLFFTPNTGTGFDVVGFVQSTDPDPQLIRGFRIAAGNADGAFSIDPGTGRILAAYDDDLPPGGERVLTVEAFYELQPGRVGSGQVTIQRMPSSNQPPNATYNGYTVTEGTSVAGNLLTDGLPDSDFDGDAFDLIDVYDASNNRVALGIPTRIRSGATLTVQSDGSFVLEAISDKLNAEFVNLTYDTLKYVIADEYGGQDEATVNFTFVPVNDSHSVPDQSFTIDPDSENYDSVGTILVTNPEPDEYFSYSIESGNGANTFQINFDGTIQVNDASQLQLGEIHYLAVRVDGESGNTATTLATITIADNAPPVAHDLEYSTLADLLATGNVLTDSMLQGMAFDPDGGPLEVVAINGSAFDMGRTVNLPNGATLLVSPDGTFRYDPSESLSLARMQADSARTEVFEYTVRDAQGLSPTPVFGLCPGFLGVSEAV